MRPERLDALAAQLKAQRYPGGTTPAERSQHLAAARLYGQRLASERLTLEQIEEAAGFEGQAMVYCHMQHRLLWLVPMVPVKFHTPHDAEAHQEIIGGIADVWRAVQERAGAGT